MVNEKKSKLGEKDKKPVAPTSFSIAWKHVWNNSLQNTIA